MKLTIDKHKFEVQATKNGKWIIRTTQEGKELLKHSDKANIYNEKDAPGGQFDIELTINQ